MRKNKAMTALLACTLALQAPVAAGAAAPADNTAVKAVASSENTLQNAARKKGFKYESGKFYYYVNGVKLKNRWRWVKWYGKTYKAYFGPTGAAYAGTRQYGALVPAVKRISGAYYGFDRVGAMLKGTYVVNNRFYVFSSQTGKLNTSISAKLRAACKYGESTHLKTDSQEYQGESAEGAETGRLLRRRLRYRLHLQEFPDLRS